MSNMQNLAEQIWSITEASYPVSLSILDKLLVSEQDFICYKSFALCNPCSVQKLAFHSSCELSRGQQSLPVILRLAKSKVFAHALINSNPLLLEQIIGTTIANQFAPDLHLELTLALLSYPLPTNVLLPSCSESLFFHLSTTSYRSPSLATILAFYDLLNGACSQLPSLLPRETFLNVENSFVKIIKSPNLSLRDQEWPLICLGILALLNQNDKELSLSQISSQFFSASDKKVYSTLNLAVVQAIFLCKDKRQASVSDARKRVGIAIQILEATDLDTRQQWATSEAGRDNIQRLRKCLESHCTIHPDLQMRLWVLFSLIQKPTPTDMSYYSSFLSQSLSNTSCQEYDLDYMVILAHIYTPLLDSNAIQFIFRQAIHLLQQGDHSGVGLTHALYIHVSAILAASKASETARMTIHGAVNSINDLVQPLIDFDISESTCTRSIPCGKISVRHRNSLNASLTEILVQDAATANQSSTISASQISDLLKHLKNISEHTHCSESLPQTDSVPVMDTVTPKRLLMSTSANLSWEQKVHLFMEREYAAQTEATKALVREICGDLVNLELPLREERARTSALEMKLTDATNEASNLRRQIVDRDIVIQELQNDKMFASQDQSQLQAENNHLQNTIQELESQLRQNTTENKNQMANLEQKLGDRLLDLKTLETTTRERAKDLTEQVANFKSTLQTLQAQKNSDEQRIIGHKDQILVLQAAEQKNLAAKERQLESIRQENTDLVKEKDSSRKQCENLSNQLAESNLQLIARRKQHAQEIAAREEELQKRDTSHRKHVENMQTEHHHSERALESRLEEAFATFQEEKNALMSAIEQKDSILTNLEQDVDHLNKFIERQDSMIVGLRNMKNIGGVSSLADSKQYRTRRQTRRSIVDTPKANLSVCRRTERSLKFEQGAPASKVYEEEEDTQVSLQSSRKRLRTPRKQATSSRAPKQSKLMPDGTARMQDEQAVTQATTRRQAMDDITMKRNGSPLKSKQMVVDNGKKISSDSFGLSSIEFQSTQAMSLDGSQN